MKYKCFKKEQKNETSGGAYWVDADFDEHLKLTEYQTTYQHLVKTYDKPRSLLEAGCGIGRWVIPLSKEGFDVTGIEIEQEAVDTLNQHFKADNLAVVQGDIFDMPFEDGTFDHVISLGVLEHFEDKAVQRKAIQEHMRVMKDDGRFLITVPYLSFVRLMIHVPFLQLVKLVRYFKGTKSFFTEYRYGKSEFEQVIKDNGMVVEEIVWDDMTDPYNFGLTVDYPINRFLKDGRVQYKGNGLGNSLFRMLWKISPALVSGGIGFVCKKA